MKSGWILWAVVFSFGLAFTGQAALTPDQIKALPPAAAHSIDFKTEIKPIFESSCIRCHGRGRAKGGLQIDSRESLLKGGDTGPAAVPGRGADSFVVALVSGLDPDEVMPKKGKKLTPEQCGVIRAWIDQGLPWPADVGFGPLAAQNLDPRRPVVPQGGDEGNPVDRFMDVYFSEHHIQPAAPVSDRVFARRVYLDTIGLLPPPGELETFVSSHAADKRAKLAADLLSRREAYAENWLSFWNDLLRNDYKGAGYIDGGRRQITRWLYSALRTNMPYDQFVSQLISPTDASSGFIKGIVWRGVVNASQKPEMQAAQNVSQVFLGVNLKCASCHDSFINDWQLSDSYGLANVFSDQPLEINECDKPTGKMAATKFLFPQVGGIASATNKQARLRELARVLICPKDGRLTRTLVNRLWARFMGRGLVEPVDDMQQTAWNQDLLDWLAEDFAAHHYDVKALITRILTSRAYQMPSVDPGEAPRQDYVFTGPQVRRISAEEFRDALTSLTGVGYVEADADIGVAEKVTRQFAPKKSAKWIWNDPKAADGAKAGHIYLRKVINLPVLPDEATAVAFCDNSFELFVNGHKAGSGDDYTKPTVVNMKPWLVEGRNVIAVHAVNNLPNNTVPPSGPPQPGTENPAGFFAYARVRAGDKDMDFGTDSSWQVTDLMPEGWETPSFTPKPGCWQPASELGAIGIVPWRVSANTISEIFARQYAAAHGGSVRAALVAADPLMTALGRPNREQVVTTRPTTATTLQALELTNGKTLAETIRHGADEIVQHNDDGPKLIAAIYEQAVGRKPTRQETKLAESLMGRTPKAADVEDFLWAVVMLPEFQLIY